MIIKRLLVVLLIGLMLISAASCGMVGSTTEKYSKAFNNTINAQTMQARTELKMKMDLSKASEEQREVLEQFKDVTLNVDESIDQKKGKADSNYYFSNGSFMVNMKLFVDGDDVFMKMPKFDSDSKAQYLKLEPKEAGFFATEDTESSQKYKEFFDELYKVWMDVVQNEIIASEGNSIESTPDGEIKVTQLSLGLTDQKVKNILDKLAQLVSRSEVVKESSIEMSKMYADESISEEDMEKGTREFFDNIIDNVDKFNDTFTLEKLKLTAKIDKDLYIIDETLEGDLVIKDGTKGEVRISFDVHTTRWNIDKDIEVNIPEIKEDEIIHEEDFKDFQSEFKDLIEKFKKD